MADLKIRVFKNAEAELETARHYPWWHPQGRTQVNPEAGSCGPSRQRH